MNESFFSYSTLATVGGASFGVVIVSNTFRYISKHSSLLPAIIMSLLLSFFNIYNSTTWSGISNLGFNEYVLIILNSCLLFCTALGMNETTVGIASKPSPGENEPFGKGEMTWISSWFKG